jgi:hypothetical protein
MTELNIAPVTWRQSWVRGKGNYLGGHLAARLGEGKGSRLGGSPLAAKMGEGEKK